MTVGKSVLSHSVYEKPVVDIFCDNEVKNTAEAGHTHQFMCTYWLSSVNVQKSNGEDKIAFSFFRSFSFIDMTAIYNYQLLLELYLKRCVNALNWHFILLYYYYRCFLLS